MNNRNPHPSFALLESDEAYFSKVPASFLSLIKLLHHEKMNYREMAQQTGLPIGTVKSRIARGRDVIRRCRDMDFSRAETRQEALHA